MGRIKSAWELALERTSDIKGDREAVRAHELKQEGKKLASKFLNADTPDEKILTEGLKEYEKQERKEVENSAFEVLLSQVSLPRDQDFGGKLETVKKGLGALTGKTKRVGSVIDQLSQFFQQYLQYQQQITEQLKQQYEPQLRRKQQQLSKQYGYSVELKAEQDPEFNQILKQNLEQLEEQYQQALSKAREDLRSFLG